MFDNNIKILFDNDSVLLCAGNSDVFAQQLVDYPRLRNATDEQKTKWKLSSVGIHWEELDEDISFESFFYDTNDPLVVKMR
jgi:hypothetical protein